MNQKLSSYQRKEKLVSVDVSRADLNSSNASFLRKSDFSRVPQALQKTMSPAQKFARTSMGSLKIPNEQEK